MARRIQSAMLLAVLVASAAFASAETLDRIVVVVNKGIILASQWDQAIRFEALAGGKDLRALTDADCAATLDRLIDQELLEQQIANTTYQPASADEIAARVAELRRQLAPGADDARWRALLARYGLSDDDLRERVAVQVDILRFIDLRFRPSIHIDPRTITAYYNTTFVPQVEATGAQPPPLKQASARIEEILVQQRVDDLLNAYLKNLRAQSRIQMMGGARPDKEAKAR